MVPPASSYALVACLSEYPEAPVSLRLPASIAATRLAWLGHIWRSREKSVTTRTLVPGEGLLGIGPRLRVRMRGLVAMKKPPETGGFRSS